MSSKSEEIGERVVANINERDWSQIDKLCTEDVQLRLPPHQVFYGRDGVRDFFVELQRRTNELTITARRIYAGDDYAIIEYEAVGHPTKLGEAEDMGAIVLQLHGDRISRCQVYLDTAQWKEMS